MKRKRLAAVLAFVMLWAMIFTTASATKMMLNSMVELDVRAIDESDNENDTYAKEIFNDPDLCDNLKKISVIINGISSDG